MECDRTGQDRTGQGLSNAVPFLDFASGYGALERLLVHHLPSEQIYTSDIKKQGVDFQVKQFGVNGIYSTFIPEEFTSSTPFKFIYVASLFSHLPDELFQRWLKKLWELTDKDGVFVFTVHDVSIINEKHKDIVYFEKSEDSLIVSVEDRITDKNMYGSTYVSETYVKNSLAKLGISEKQYGRYERSFCGLQDIYVVSHKENEFDETLKFTYFDGNKY